MGAINSRICSGVRPADQHARLHLRCLNHRRQALTIRPMVGKQTCGQRAGQTGLQPLSRSPGHHPHVCPSRAPASQPGAASNRVRHRRRAVASHLPLRGGHRDRLHAVQVAALKGGRLTSVAQITVQGQPNRRSAVAQAVPLECVRKNCVQMRGAGSQATTNLPEAPAHRVSAPRPCLRVPGAATPSSDRPVAVRRVAALLMPDAPLPLVASPL